MTKFKDPITFKKEIFNLVGNEYSLLSPYKCSSLKVKMKHNKCNNVYYVRPNDFLRGGRCPYCNGNKAKHKTTDQFKREVYKKVGNEYTVLGNYINRSTPILMRHNKCGREYLVEPGNFLYHSRCKECRYEDKRLSIKEVKYRIKERLGSSYELVKYPGNVFRKTLIKHTLCGTIFGVRLDDVWFKRSGCPVCRESRGEDYIREYLNTKGYKFEFQKSFIKLRDKNPLFYDFYIPSLNVLIEYQGTQHYMPKNFGGYSKDIAIHRLKIQKYHDELKRDFAKKNGKILLTPSYKLNCYSKVSKYLDKELLKVKQGILNQN
jgi:hypothetical protein